MVSERVLHVQSACKDVDDIMVSARQVQAAQMDTQKGKEQLSEANLTQNMSLKP